MVKAHIKKKCQDQEDQNKEKEEQAAKEVANKEKAKEKSQKKWLIVSLGFPLCSQKLTGFQMLQKQKDACKALQVGVVGKYQKFFSGVLELTCVGSHPWLLKCPDRVWRWSH